MSISGPFRESFDRWAREANVSDRVVIDVLHESVAAIAADRDALRLMLQRLLDVSLVDGYGETVADEARALLAEGDTDV